ncbi:multifunctional CCA tRNA nucleotidyl transferase/2'3'-cyclic phosphodiesterase/2'nucleotidase/phosphatase [Endozoicomonas sp. OPT23]|uniref:multifunctional CCA tRNA nucleotidyl transferase/2'3'-cyclic phosphodiesterase/2'nucleotidase/phosphatase n=1 Tax=Endozoicomonas sp. OPT23 TaxID=2072845 RepID=UPI00129BF91B|nr:multifunctional CCA tRNA nucleotidyl transferase/2'3'-cyclic phosphodiesterase/2'nucleotidase/phosphatase [Endozoicomonas sp. OPT23]MRI31824.1 multifunctional CCA tRNA nucleotidyl transferase/2'3'-cyclic phosphodiesterase/2'nucleotidase/phosphatase [Endozoicomonas sp. OPT23]
MKAFLVGGAVRDRLLGIEVKDNDWVVVGSTPKEMIKQGFQPVGQDFPVFLHPKTREEYALARTERKSGHGYAGFTFHTSADVTLEEDLIRRDLTINAMAEDESGKIIDPFNGQQDLKNKLLRHVSPAFQEDPLRILRVARFAARFHHFGFAVAPETNELMKKMVADDEASWLVPERVWQETVRALSEQTPSVYFEVLAQCNALSVVLPELINAAHSNDIKQALQLASTKQSEAEVRLALCFTFDTFDNKAIKAFAKRQKLPTHFSELTALVTAHINRVHTTLNDLSGESLINLYEQTDAFRRSERFSQLLEVADIHGQVVNQPLVKSTVEQVKAILEECKGMSAREFVEQGYKGREVGEQLRIARIERIDSALNQQ